MPIVFEDSYVEEILNYVSKSIESKEITFLSKLPILRYDNENIVEGLENVIEELKKIDKIEFENVSFLQKGGSIIFNGFCLIDSKPAGFTFHFILGDDNNISFTNIIFNKI